MPAPAADPVRAAPAADPFARKRLVRPGRRLVLALSRASAVALVIVLTASATVIAPVGSRRAARDVAGRELQALLVPGESIRAQAFASLRRPSDFWRLSHGVLVATDRRLLYLAVPPRTLLRPNDDGPPELYVERWLYDAAFTSTLTRTGDDNQRFLLQTPTRSITLRVDGADSAAASAIERIAAQERRSAEAAAEQLRRSGISPIVPDRYTTHVVRRGETLTGIAVQYATTVDVLRQLNRLESDAVRAGARLRVPEPRAVRDPFGTDSSDTDDIEDTEDTSATGATRTTGDTTAGAPISSGGVPPDTRY